MTHHYPGQERRDPSWITAPEVKSIVDQALIEHEDREKENMQSVIEDLKDSAFPDGDPAPHRVYHEAKIAATNAQKQAEESRGRMYDAMRGKIIEQGIAGIFGVLKILVVLGLGALAIKAGVAIPDWLTK